MATSWFRLFSARVSVLTIFYRANNRQQIETYNAWMGDLEKVHERLKRLRSRTVSPPNNDPAPCSDDEDDQPSSPSRSPSSVREDSIQAYQREKLVSELASSREKLATLLSQIESQRDEIETLQLQLADTSEERDSYKMRIYIESVKSEEKRVAALESVRVAGNAAESWNQRCLSLEKDASDLQAQYQAALRRAERAESSQRALFDQINVLEAQKLEVKSRSTPWLSIVSSIGQLTLITLIALLWLSSTLQSSRHTYSGM